MKALQNESLKAALARFDARPQRERLLILGAVLALAFLLLDRAWIMPAWRDYQSQRALLAQAQAAQEQLRAALAQRQQLAREQGQTLLRELSQARSQLQRSEAQLAQRGGALVHASEMVALLEGVLKDKGPGLRLVGLQNLPRSELGSSAETRLYRHGVELTLEGSYAELLAYCQALEALPQKLLWGGLQLDAQQHPRLRLQLRLYTLSQDSQWLEL